MWYVTCDMWHMTCDTWHMICDTWQVGGGEPSLKSIFSHFLFTTTRNSLHKVLVFNIFLIFFLIQDSHKSGRKSDISKKLNVLCNQFDTVFFCVFPLHESKPNRNYWMASSIAKLGLTLSQTCMNYRGIILFIKRNIDTNIGDLIFFFMSKYVFFV